MNKEYFTISQVAQKLQVNEETVRRWIRTNKLHAIINSKKEGFKITQDDLKKFVLSNYKYALYIEDDPDCRVKIKDPDLRDHFKEYINYYINDYSMRIVELTKEIKALRKLVEDLF